MTYRSHFCLISLLVYCLNAAAESALVAVASNMSHAIQEISEDFKQQTEDKIILSIGSSGNLSHQIINGSPHELFLSANADYISLLEDKEKTILNSKIYAIGQLCLFIPNQSAFKDESTLDAILHRVSFGHFDKMAVANPEIAPYGNAAIYSLRNMGVWVFDPRKIVIAENVSQATQFALTSSVDLAFIPYSHSLIETVYNKGSCHKIPKHLHPPIVQKMVLTQSASNTAKAFFQFMSSTSAKNVLTKYGYSLP